MLLSKKNAISLLDNRALVLNRSWVPVNVTSVRRALELLYREAAVAVHIETYETFDFAGWAARDPSSLGPCIASVRAMIPLPEVILLVSYDRIPRRFVPFSRRNLYRRDRLRCQYCRRVPGVKKLTIDHVVPRSMGGETSWTNCVLACVACNGRKGNQTLEQAGMRLSRSPTRPEWFHAVDMHASELAHIARRFRAV